MIIDFRKSYKIYEENADDCFDKNNIAGCLDNLYLASKNCPNKIISMRYLKRIADILTGEGCFKESNEILSRLIADNYNVQECTFHYILNLSGSNTPISKLMFGKLSLEADEIEADGGILSDEYGENMERLFENFINVGNDDIVLLSREREEEAADLLLESCACIDRKDYVNLNYVLEDFEILSRKNPFACELYIFTLIKSGDLHTANTSLRFMEKNFKDTPEFYFAKAELLAAENNKEELIKVLKKINGFEELKRYVHLKRRIILNLQAGNFSEALNFAKEEWERVDNFDFESNKFLAFTYSFCGEKQKAKEIMMNMYKLYRDIYPSEFYAEYFSKSNYEPLLTDITLSYPENLEVEFLSLFDLLKTNEDEFADEFNNNEQFRKIFYFAIKLYPYKKDIINAVNLLFEKQNYVVEDYFKYIISSPTVPDQIKYYIIFQLVYHYKTGNVGEYSLCLNEMMGKVNIAHISPLPEKSQMNRIFIVAMQFFYYQNQIVSIEKLLYAVSIVEKAMNNAKIKLYSDRTLSYIVLALSSEYNYEQTIKNCSDFEVNEGILKKYINSLNLSDKFMV